MESDCIANLRSYTSDPSKWDLGIVCSNAAFHSQAPPLLKPVGDHHLLEEI